jgi:hypothetical protein
MSNMTLSSPVETLAVRRRASGSRLDRPPLPVSAAFVVVFTRMDASRAAIPQAAIEEGRQVLDGELERVETGPVPHP